MTRVARWQRVGLTTAIVILALAFVAMWLYPLAVLFGQAGRAHDRSPGALRDLAWSALAAATSSACATLMGGFAALGARTIPRRHAAILDTAVFVPILFPPFVIGTAVRSGIGRAGLWQVTTAGNFSGFWPMVLTWTIAYLPLSYGASRVALHRVGSSSVDTARVSGLNGSRLVGLIIVPLRAVSPVVFLLVFVLVLADPVVPHLVGGKTPNTAERLWLQVTAFGADAQAAQTALMLMIPALVCGVLAGATAGRSRQSLSGRSKDGSLGRRPSASVPVGVTVWPRAAPGIVVGGVGLTVLAVLVGRAGDALFHRHDEITIPSNVLVNTIGLGLLAAVVALLLVSLSTWVTSVLRSARVVIFACYVALLAVPGATLGVAYSQAYGPHAWSPVFFLAGGSAPASGTILIVGSYVSTAAPLVYFAMQVYPMRTARQVWESALMFADSRSQAFATVIFPQVRHDAALTLTVVVASSSVMVAPLMWVTSPDSPVIVPRLFVLLDHAQYSVAFVISTACALVLMILLVVTRWTLDARRRGGRE
ncbi:hypothetical protein [Cutibacterium sp. V947]|uniref:hypothetical protein n=1 Tax=Cutibacterium sp. V947 TaxID=3446480 RepID=UPI003EE240DA